MKKSVIDVQNMSFFFGSLTVLENVTFSIMEREMIGVVGPNGGGKTTLLRLMLGLIKPDKGTITVLGNLPEKSSHRVGYVPQHRLF